MRISSMNFGTKSHKNRAHSIFLKTMSQDPKNGGCQGPREFSLAFWYCFHLWPHRPAGFIALGPLVDYGLPQSSVCLPFLSTHRDGLSLLLNQESGPSFRPLSKGQVAMRRAYCTDVFVGWEDCSHGSGECCDWRGNSKRNHHRCDWDIKPISLWKQKPSASVPEVDFTVETTGRSGGYGLKHIAESSCAKPQWPPPNLPWFVGTELYLSFDH